MKFVNVIVDISSEQLDRVFLYRVPDALKKSLQIGMQVHIPFGVSNRQRKGYVVGFLDEANYPLEKIKEVKGIVKGSIKAESQLIALAAWMRENYGSTMNQALKTVLPVKQKTKQKHKQELTKLERQAEDTFETINGLHRTKTAGASVFAYIFGCIAALILDGGMCLTMLIQNNIPHLPAVSFSEFLVLRFAQ